MSAERSGQRELAQLVSDHLLRHVNTRVPATVVNQECMTDELGRDRRAAGPRLDRLFFVGQRQPLHLFQELQVDKRALF